MKTPDPFSRTPDATPEQKQGAAGCLVIGAWLLAIPVVLVFVVLGLPAAAIGVAVGVALVTWWVSAKAKVRPPDPPSS